MNALKNFLRFAVLCGMTIPIQAAEDLELNLCSQSKHEANEEPRMGQVKWDPKKTALIICDMWDDHWCKSAARRVGEIAPALNETVMAARAKGVFIVHAPSSVVDFYNGAPQRKLAEEAPFSKAPT